MSGVRHLADPLSSTTATELVKIFKNEHSVSGNGHKVIQQIEKHSFRKFYQTSEKQGSVAFEL